MDLERVTLDPPEGYRDATDYTFASRGGKDAPREQLTVSQEEAPPGTTAQAIIAEQRATLEATKTASVEKQDAAPLDGMTAQTLTLSYADGGVRYRERWAAAVRAGRSILVRYAAPVADEKADATFRQILASIAWGKPPAEKPAAPECIRRTVQDMTLEVPDRLQPPRTYLFLSRDEHVRLTVSLYESSQEMSRKTLEEEVQSDAPRATMIQERTAQPLAVADGHGQQFQYTVRRGASPANALAIRRAEVSLPDGPILRASGRASLQYASQLQQDWQSLIGSIRRR